MYSDTTCDTIAAFELPNKISYRSKIKSIREVLTSMVERTDAAMVLS